MATHRIKKFGNKGVDLSSLHRLYISLWLITIILYSFHLIGYYGVFEWDGKLSLFLFATIFAMFISGFQFNNSKQLTQRVDFNTLFNESIVTFITQKANGLFLFWVFGNLVTVVLQGGFPLLWLLLGIPKTYADYGLPTFNGFLNSLYYLCGLFYFITLLKNRSRQRIMRFVLLIIFPVLTINRAMFLVLTLQCMGIVLLTNKIRVKALLKIIALVLILVIGFGIIGDMRLGSNKYIIRALVSSEYSGFQEKSPSGFIWTYLYATGTIDNLNYNINSIKAIGYPYYSVQSLIPSVLRTVIYGTIDYEHRYSLSMSNSLFNTFSWLANYLRDFGFFFTVVIVFLYGCLFRRIQTHARRGSIKYVFLYPIVFMVVVLSIFWDYMISLPTLFEIIIICRIFTPSVVRRLEV